LRYAVIEEASLGVAEGTGGGAGRSTGEEDLIGGALRLGVGESFGFDFSDLSGRLAGHLLHTLATSLQVADKAGQALAADLAHVNARLVEAVFQLAGSGVQHRTVLGAVAAAADEALIQAAEISRIEALLPVDAGRPALLWISQEATAAGTAHHALLGAHLRFAAVTYYQLTRLRVKVGTQVGAGGAALLKDLIWSTAGSKLVQIEINRCTSAQRNAPAVLAVVSRSPGSALASLATAEDAGGGAAVIIHLTTLGIALGTPSLRRPVLVSRKGQVAGQAVPQVRKTSLAAHFGSGSAKAVSISTISAVGGWQANFSTHWPPRFRSRTNPGAHAQPRLHMRTQG
ncbi:hypothetical protein TYRP_015397, partial [Tyrophagus putrescentiae]